jgi:uncharacterized protein YceK
MIIRIVVFFILVFVLGGCATGSKKQATQSQPMAYEKSQRTYEQESYSKDYGYDDTWSSDKKTYSEPEVILSVKQVQLALRKSGFYQGPIDGKVGSKTKQAIIKFQKANNLKADGIVGKKTSVALNKYLLK